MMRRGNAVVACPEGGRRRRRRRSSSASETVRIPPSSTIELRPHGSADGSNLLSEIIGPRGGVLEPPLVVVAIRGKDLEVKFLAAGGPRFNFLCDEVGNGRRAEEGDLERRSRLRRFRWEGREALDGGIGGRRRRLVFVLHAPRQERQVN